MTPRLWLTVSCLFVCLPLSSAKVVLFVLHDAGESLALLPVVRRLHAKMGGFNDVLVLPLGEPATSMTLCQGRYAADCEPVPYVTPAQIGISLRMRDGTEGRNQTLSQYQLKLLKRLKDERQISAVITGMNYRMQYQVGSKLQRGGAQFIAYYDGLSVVGTDSDAGTQIEFVHANSIWVPSLVLQPNEEVWKKTAWVAVGQPTLESWRDLLQNEDMLRSIRERIYGRNALQTGAPAAVWFGGYGWSYAEALRLWCRSVKRMRSEGPSNMLFSLAIHPGPFGEIDRKVLKEEGVRNLIKIVPDDVLGAAAALASNVTVSQGSTGGEQSIFAGKPAIFVDPTGKNPFGLHLSSLLGCIQTVQSSSEAVRVVRKIAAENWTFNVQRLEAAGVPMNSTDVMTGEVIKLLSDHR